MIISLAQLEETLPPNYAVLISGGFDPLHYGHIRYIKAASEWAKDHDRPVVVAVASDSYIARKHPVLQNIEARMEMIDAIRWVDYVVPQGEETAASVIRASKPHVFLKGDDWLQRGLPKLELEALEAVGAHVRYVPVHSVSSSGLLRDFAWSFFDQMTARA